MVILLLLPDIRIFKLIMEGHEMLYGFSIERVLEKGITFQLNINVGCMFWDEQAETIYHLLI